MRHLLASVALLASLAGAGCGSDTTTSPSTTTTTATTATTSTELFTGTLAPRGSAFYSFGVTTGGTVSVTLVSTTTSRVGPAGASPLSIGFGIPSGFGCAVATAIDATAGLTSQLAATGSASGIYCINVADVAGLSGDTLFVIRIVHT